MYCSVRMLQGFYLLFIALHVTKGCSLINNRKTLNIAKYVGDAVLLPCSCSNLSITPQTLTWRKNNKLEDYWDSVSTNQGRFQLSNVQSPGNLSLFISHLTVEDDGLYRCQLTGSEYTDIILSVKGGSTTEPTVPPEPPNHAFLAFIPVVLLLLGLGGVFFWRRRVAKKRAQTPRSEEPTGQKNEEEAQWNEKKTQDDVMYTTVVHSNASQRPKAVFTEERTEYAIIKLK